MEATIDSKITNLENGAMYQAEIRLGVVEKYFGNKVVTKKLESFGFSNVVVEGVDTHRTATGKWAKPNLDLTKFGADIKKYVVLLKRI